MDAVLLVLLTTTAVGRCPATTLTAALLVALLTEVI